MYHCRFPNYGNGCQLKCDCIQELCNHISGCPNPAKETTDGINSETHRGRSVPGEKKNLENLAVTKKPGLPFGNIGTRPCKTFLCF